MRNGKWFNRFVLLAACVAIVVTASAADPVPNTFVNGGIAAAP